MSMGTGRRSEGQYVRDFTRALRIALEAALGAEWRIYNEFELDLGLRTYRTFEMWKQTWQDTWRAPHTNADWRFWPDKICIGMTALRKGPNDEPNHFRIGVIKGPERPRNVALRDSLARRFRPSVTSDQWWVWGVRVDERYKDWGRPDVQARLRQGDEALSYFIEFFWEIKEVAGPEIERELGLR